MRKAYNIYMNTLCISRPERRAPAPQSAHETAVAVGAMADAVRRALAADCAEDDITTRWAVPDGTRARARVVARQDGVIAGTAIPAEVYRQLGSDVVVTEHVQDGDRVHAGQDLLTLAGPAREERYARPGVDAVARHVAKRDPAARRRT